MSTRLAQGGRLVDRNTPVSFTFNGRQMRGFKGDTLASALLANDQMLVGRSFKYHRPRGIVASGAEEPNGLVNLGTGGQFEPNQRVTTQEVFEGLSAGSQNHWPSLEFDVGAANAKLGRFMPAGFYYKMFIHPRPLWKHVYEPFIRKAAGLGRAPKDRDDDVYEHFYAHVDVMVVGGGIAGLSAALAAGRSGARVLLVEQTADWGGRAVVDGAQIDGLDADAWVKNALQVLERMSNVTCVARCMGAGVYDHGYALAYERLTDHLAEKDGPRHRLWRIRARQIVTATGAIERPLSFAGNDIPGVMLASASRWLKRGWTFRRLWMPARRRGRWQSRHNPSAFECCSAKALRPLRAASGSKGLAFVRRPARALCKKTSPVTSWRCRAVGRLLCICGPIAVVS